MPTTHPDAALRAEAARWAVSITDEAPRLLAAVLDGAPEAERLQLVLAPSATDPTRLELAIVDPGYLPPYAQLHTCTVADVRRFLVERARIRAAGGDTATLPCPLFGAQG